MILDMESRHDSTFISVRTVIMSAPNPQLGRCDLGFANSNPGTDARGVRWIGPGSSSACTICSKGGVARSASDPSKGCQLPRAHAGDAATISGPRASASSAPTIFGPSACANATTAAVCTWGARELSATTVSGSGTDADAAGPLRVRPRTATAADPHLRSIVWGSAALRHLHGYPEESGSTDSVGADRGPLRVRLGSG